MKPNSAYIFFSNTFPHLLQTNFVFPFFPLTPAAAPATTAPTGPKSTPPTISPAMAFPILNQMDFTQEEAEMIASVNIEKILRGNNNGHRNFW